MLHVAHEAELALCTAHGTRGVHVMRCPTRLVLHAGSSTPRQPQTLAQPESVHRASLAQELHRIIEN